MPEKRIGPGAESRANPTYSIIAGHQPNSIVSDTPDRTAFAPLTESELAAANSIEAVKAHAFDEGYRLGLIRGAMWAKSECLVDHRDLLNQLDAARRFAELGGRPALDGDGAL